MVTKLVSYYELRQTLYGLHPAQKRVLLNDLQADLSAYDASQAINVEAIAPNLPDLSNTPHPVDRREVARLAFEGEVLDHAEISAIEQKITEAVELFDVYLSRQRSYSRIAHHVLSMDEHEAFSRLYWPDLFPNPKPDSL